MNWYCLVFVRNMHFVHDFSVFLLEISEEEKKIVCTSIKIWGRGINRGGQDIKGCKTLKKLSVLTTLCWNFGIATQNEPLFLLIFFLLLLPYPPVFLYLKDEQKETLNTQESLGSNIYIVLYSDRFHNSNQGQEGESIHVVMRK